MSLALIDKASKLTDARKAEARRRRAEGATLAELARSYDVGNSTISRLTAKRREAPATGLLKSWVTSPPNAQSPESEPLWKN
jgi:hypothetical protein